MKIGMATINDPQQEWGEKIGKRLAERSGGRVTYKVFPLSQLGTIARQVEATLLGTQEVFLTPPAFYVGVNQAFMVPDAPGIFLNQKHGKRRDPRPRVQDALPVGGGEEGRGRRRADRL